MDTFIGEHKFKTFLDENMKNPNYNYDACLEDLELQHGNTGGCEYELSPFETKSGRPETFSYHLEETFYLDGNVVSVEDSDFDESDRKFIFSYDEIQEKSSEKSDSCKISNARKCAGLTQKAMSDLLEIPLRTIENWENGKRNPPPWAEKLIAQKLESLKNFNRVVEEAAKNDNVVTVWCHECAEQSTAKLSIGRDGKPITTGSVHGTSFFLEDEWCPHCGFYALSTIPYPSLDIMEFTKYEMDCENN